MTASDSASQPRTASQQFTFKDQSAPDVALTARNELVETDHRVNTAFPLPQANDLTKLAAVVDHLRDGNDTGVAMARALDVSERQGYYYADAAGYLGLVETSPASDIRTYVLSPLGVEMLEMDGAERREFLRYAVGGMPAVKTFKAEGEDAMFELLSDQGLGEGTAARRSASVTSWVEALEGEDDFGASVDMELQQAGERSRASAVLCGEEREERTRAAAAAQPKQAEICMDCFMAKASSGTCGC